MLSVPELLWKEKIYGILNQQNFLLKKPSHGSQKWTAAFMRHPKWFVSIFLGISREKQNRNCRNEMVVSLSQGIHSVFTCRYLQVNWFVFEPSIRIHLSTYSEKMGESWITLSYPLQVINGLASIICLLFPICNILLYLSAHNFM